MSTVGYHLEHETQPSKVMYLDSRDGNGVGTDTTEFTYVFDDAITTRDNEGVLVSLLSATIPYSFYNIRGGVNDQLSFQVEPLDAATYFADVVTLPEGNYTATSLRTAVADLLTAKATALGFATAIAVNFDRVSQKFKFSTETADRRVRLLFNLEPLSFHTELGFAKAEKIFTTAQDLVSDNVIDINGSIHAVHIRTDLPTLAVFDSQSGKASDILAKVTLNTNPGGIIFHDPRDTKHESLLRTSTIKGIKVKLTDERDRVLSLNGLHFQIGILFRFVSLKPSEPLQDLRQLLLERRRPPKNRRDQRDQRKKALQKGKQKIKTAQQKAAEASKTSQKTDPKKPSSSK